MRITDHEVRDLRLFLLELRYDLVLGCDLHLVLLGLFYSRCILLRLLLLALLASLFRCLRRVETCAC